MLLKYLISMLFDIIFFNEVTSHEFMS